MATTHDFPTLAGHEFAVLTTYRRDGTAVPTTVWFAEAGGRLYIQTGANSGKVRRILANPAVTVAPSTRVGEVLGEATAATARLLAADEAAVAEAALERKYGERRRQVMAQMGGFERGYLEVVPTA